MSTPASVLDGLTQPGARPGRRMTGPSALAGDPRRLAILTWTLAKLEFKLKFFGSVLGYFWQLARPLMFFGVLLAVFTIAFDVGSVVRNYPIVLLMGIVAFTFLSEASNGAVESVVMREGLVRKIHFPRLVIPLAVVVTAYLNFAVNFSAVLIFALAFGVEVRWAWLELIPLIGLLGLFATGLAMLLSALFVRYRDVRPIWDVVLQAIFYASPIIWPLELLKVDWLQHLLLVNPLAAVVVQMRHALVDPRAPTLVEAIGGYPLALAPLAVVVAVVALGFWVFNRAAPRVAEEL
jgi:ABC-2 type transport system permease protein